MKQSVSEKQKNFYFRHLVLIAGVIGALLASMWLSSLPITTAGQLPPLPPVPTATLTPMPKPTSPPATGSFIELHIQFPQAWPWDKVHWQELWTVVQWQDDQGLWRNVEGWQGTLDNVMTGEDRDVVGCKKWWVAKGDLGKGPFRWVVYKSQGGAALATSEAFYLPDTLGETVRIDVALNQIQ
jgi:hypothetical protein